jgi:hypothetical protein
MPPLFVFAQRKERPERGHGRGPQRGSPAGVLYHPSRPEIYQGRHSVRTPVKAPVNRHERILAAAGAAPPSVPDGCSGLSDIS